MSNKLIEQVKETAFFLQKKTKIVPAVGIIFGTGLTNLSKDMEIEDALSYSDIPNFPLSTVESHAGKLLFGTLAGKPVIAMQGRFHYYEGYTMQEVTFPIRVMRELGVETLIISNAAGSLNPMYRKGSIMILDDYINLLGGTPLMGAYHSSMGPRFPDMSAPYSTRLIAKAEEIALKKQIFIKKGIYAAMPGPCLETRAEYRMLKLLGADAIGMSTIPETIVAKQIGLETIAFSILTDECYPDALQSVTLEEIIAIAATAEPNLSILVKELIKQL